MEKNSKLKCLQKEVSGRIESISYMFPTLISKNILVYINQESRICNFPTTLIYCKKNKEFEEVKGNICFTKISKKGEIVGLKDRDISLIYETVRKM